jgi:hypothetical protein
LGGLRFLLFVLLRISGCARLLFDGANSVNSSMHSVPQEHKNSAISTSMKEMQCSISKIESEMGELRSSVDEIKAMLLAHFDNAQHQRLACSL